MAENNKTPEDNNKNKRLRQILNIGSLIFVLALGSFGYSYLNKVTDAPKVAKQKEEEEKIPVTLGTHGINGAKLWQNSFNIG